MQYRQLGQTDINVSVISLGTMTWGEQNTEAEAHEQLDFALDSGVNLIDVAEMYPVPPSPDTCGLTETYTGTWLARRKDRDKIIFATKVAGPSPMTWIRDGSEFDEKNIRTAIEGSLKRLQTDYIDLYQLHWPSRSTNYFGQLGYTHNPNETPVPLEETLNILSQLVKEGKIRHFGLSNETPWGTMKFLQLADSSNGVLPRAVSIQNPYSLLNRSFEVGLSEVAIREQCGLLAYSPMAFGLLSGKFQNNQQPPKARLTRWANHFNRYASPESMAAANAYINLAKQHDLSPAQMSLAFVNTRPFVTSNIIGATTMEQLRENIESIHTPLTPELLNAIDAIHKQHPNPAP